MITRQVQMVVMMEVTLVEVAVTLVEVAMTRVVVVAAVFLQDQVYHLLQPSWYSPWYLRLAHPRMHHPLPHLQGLNPPQQPQPSLP